MDSRTASDMVERLHLFRKLFIRTMSRGGWSPRRRKFFSRTVLILAVVALAGCPRERRYVLNNFSGEDLTVLSTDGDVSVRNLESVTIDEYGRAFESDKEGHHLLKMASEKGNRCFVMDISSYDIDRPAYYGRSGPKSTRQIVLLPDGEMYAIPYDRHALTEVQDGSIRSRPRYRECPGPRTIITK